MSTIVTRYIAGFTAADRTAAVEALLGCSSGATVFQEVSGGTVIHHDIVRTANGIVVHSRYRSGTEDVTVLAKKLGSIDSYVSGLVNQAGKPTTDWIDLTALRAAHTVLEGHSADLPYNKSTAATLQAQTRKAFAHFHFYHREIQDLAGNMTWAPAWLHVNGESATDAPTYGGRCRTRPWPRNTIDVGTYTSVVRDCERDVHEALAMGLDGFFYNLVTDNTSLGEYTRFVSMCDAIDGMLSTGFRVLPNIDCTTVPGSNAAAMATSINGQISRSCIYTEGGVPVVSSYGSASWTLANWNTFLGICPCKIVHIYSGTFNPATNAPAAASIAYGIWGAGCPSDLDNSALATTTHTASKKWVEPLRPQDMRPYAPGYWEAKNTQMISAGMAEAISNSADWVQVITWNDYYENSGAEPGTGVQYLYADLISYYIEWFKLGSAPTIVRDVIYYSHRIEKLNVTYSAVLQTKGPITRNGSDAGTDNIELLAFLTATADLEIEVNGVVTATSNGAAAGIQRLTAAMPTVATSAGAIILRIKRSGVTIVSVASAFPVYTSVNFQDFAYRGGCSARAPAANLATASSNPS